MPGLVVAAGAALLLVAGCATSESSECTTPVMSTGNIIAPAPDSIHDAAFTVSGMVEDPNGIAQVTAIIDTLADCSFSVSPADPGDAAYTYQINVDPASCALESGSHVVNIWVEDGCGLDTQVASVAFVYQDVVCPPGSDCYHIVANPAVGDWTPVFQEQGDCVCDESNTDCHALYQGRVTSISGNTAQMEFRKVDPPGGAPSVAVDFWVVVGASPSCTQIDAFVTRTNGIWQQGQVTRSVGVNIWPTQADLEAAPCGDTKSLFIITGGGGGYEHTRTWFQRQAVVFTKTCS